MTEFINESKDPTKTEVLSDHELLVRSQNYPPAFSELVDRYQHLFIKKVRSILHNKEDAEDIVQEVFVKIYLNAQKFKPQQGATFKSWAYKILLNTTFTFYSKKRREQALVEVTDRELIEAMADEDKEWSKTIDRDRFLSVISRIPVGLARLLRMMVEEGRSDKEIAAYEGVSEGAIRTRLHRAKAEFQRVNISL